MRRIIRKSPSWVAPSHAQSFPANHSEVGHSPPQTTTSLRSLSTSPMPQSSLKGEHRTHKVDPIDNTSAHARAAVGAKPQTVWSTDDSFLPRAKPPPPLKRITHQRNHSENNTFPPCSTATSESSESHSKASRSLRSSLDLPTPDISCEQNNGRVVQTALTRSSSRASTTSEASSVADITFAPSKFGYRCEWQPPTSWAGPEPSRLVSVDEDDGSKPVEGQPFTLKKSAEKGSQDNGSGVHVPTGLSRVRSLRKLWPTHLADVRELEEAAIGTRRGPSASVVTVMVQNNEDNSWHEKSIVEVIPLLRELKVG